MREPALLGRLSMTIAAASLFFGACTSNDCHPPGGGDSCQATQASGIAGATGAAGTTATAGATGAAGTAAGAAGANGAAGTSGASSAAGAAGTLGAAGSSSDAGAAGAMGAAGAGGGATGMPNAVPSAGCNKPAAQALAAFVKYDETITASALVTAKWQPRDYWVWLPSNYDPTQAYPTVFVAPGCGGTGNMSIPIQNASGNDAIVIGLDYNAAATGRDCFMTESFPDPEVNYVEQTVSAVEGAYCIDKSRLFIEGFSSGSWISYLMGCVDGGPGGLFKAQGNASGEFQGSAPESACKGPIPYMAGHNNPDGNNAYPGGRMHMLTMNGCTMPPQTTPYDPGPMVKPPSAGVTINCVQYAGCQKPTIFCTTTGLGHNDQVGTGLSTYGFWKFWMSLP